MLGVPRQLLAWPKKHGRDEEKEVVNTLEDREDLEVIKMGQMRSYIAILRSVMSKLGDGLARAVSMEFPRHVTGLKFQSKGADMETDNTY